MPVLATKVTVAVELVPGLVRLLVALGRLLLASGLLGATLLRRRTGLLLGRILTCLGKLGPLVCRMQQKLAAHA